MRHILINQGMLFRWTNHCYVSWFCSLKQRKAQFEATSSHTYFCKAMYSICQCHVFTTYRAESGNSSGSQSENIPRRVQARLWQPVCNSWCEACQVLDGGGQSAGGEAGRVDWGRRPWDQDANHAVYWLWRCKLYNALLQSHGSVKYCSSVSIVAQFCIKSVLCKSI